MLRVDKTNEVIDLNANDSGVKDPDLWIWHTHHEVGVHSQ